MLRRRSWRERRQASRRFDIFGRRAAGELVIFNDDDVIPSPELTAEHMAFHQRHTAAPEAALGRVGWHPEVRATPFMRWLGERGPMFGFAHFSPGERLHFFAFYTCNLSLKREFLLSHGLFDERFPGAAFEDTELSWRLHQAGLRLYYHPRAYGQHYQHFNFQQAVERGRRHARQRWLFDQTEAGRSIRLAEARQPEKRCWRKFWARRLVPAYAPAMQPLLNSRLGLPDNVYALFYRYCVEQEARAQVTPNN